MELPFSLDSLSLDIRAAVQVAIALSLVGVVLCIWLGVRAIRKGRTLRFFRMRRDSMVRGWRLIFAALFLGLLAFLLSRFGSATAADSRTSRARPSGRPRSG